MLPKYRKFLAELIDVGTVWQLRFAASVLFGKELGGLETTKINCPFLWSRKQPSPFLSMQREIPPVDNYDWYVTRDANREPTFYRIYVKSQVLITKAVDVFAMYIIKML